MTFKQPTPDIAVADAVEDNWVDRYAPLWMRPYLRLSRMDRPIGTWLLFLPCLWGVTLAAASDSPKPWDLWIVAGCVVGSFLMRGAGCTWNDITDRDIDAQVARTRSRPLAARQISPQAALVWMAVQCFLAALILFTYNWQTVVLGISALIPVIIYPFAKRFTWWPQIFLGLAFNWGALLAWVAHTGALMSMAPVFLYLSGTIWTVFYDTIYAHQDKEDDALIGVKSTARLFGDKTGIWLQGALILSTVFMALAVFVALQDDGLISQVCAFIGVLGFGLHMQSQLNRLNIDDPAVCLTLFRKSNITGLIPGLFFAIAALV